MAHVRRASDGQIRDIVSSVPGKVLEMQAYRGDFVQPGSAVLTIEPSDEELLAFLYLPADSGQRITPGMGAQLEPLTIKAEEFGFLLGSVQQVSDYPATDSGIIALLNNPQLSTIILSKGPVHEVRISLRRDPATPSGYAWTSAHGQPLGLPAGTLVHGSVIVQSQRPINLLLPATR